MHTNLRRKSVRKWKKNLLWMSGFLLIVGSMVFYLWIYNHTSSLYKEIEQLRRKEASQVAQNRMLVVEIEGLSRADRIKNIAMTEIQMVTPAPETLAVILDPKILAVK
ncbi:MAG: cell division protein FtsL [Candidatus Marinimicrobia bacterium]|jgi:cell division protein FtsL|nr:cell division protein FtsL [Candidatus Neomarinimicrobiota bacterium]MCK9483279.1 cell division protein FtsL [Candidatus Neomarinimicrobiota bacterium]MCK9559545.1 cell division protein FtsL [Candidatus Neomarinimicrobiota bacterium]MDD5061405.1 cell division protein FtsL [Candidatus Neomarinimicrobiota bacterium]MDD5229805.1 cell division protein FtsL [Candidatus Neomarinimicrobiota bacterium]